MLKDENKADVFSRTIIEGGGGKERATINNGFEAEILSIR